jgi:hypothetical protein
LTHYWHLSDLHRDGFDEIVHVHVGGAYLSETFQAYAGLLRKSSGYFHRALKGPITEASSKEIDLSSEDPNIFRLYFRFLNSGRLYEDQEDDRAYQKPLGPSTALEFCTEERMLADTEFSDGSFDAVYGMSTSNHRNRPSFWTLSRLYIFADAHDIADLEDIAVSKILDNICCNGFIPIDLIPELEEHTLCDSVLYKMLVELAASFMGIGESKDRHVMMSKQLCFDIMCAQYTSWTEKFEASQKQQRGITFTACKWHRHD